MSRDDGTELLRQVKQHLDQHAEAVDELTVARLRAVRKRALAQAPRRGMGWMPVTGFAVAAAAVLAVVLWQPLGNGLPGSADDWELLASGEELDLIEEWEFYAWLDEVQANS